jgi:hypothetical protein
MGAVPISGKFEAGFFVSDDSEQIADAVEPPTEIVQPWENQMFQGISKIYATLRNRRRNLVR